MAARRTSQKFMLPIAWILGIALTGNLTGNTAAFADESETKNDAANTIKELLEEIAAEQAEARRVDGGTAQAKSMVEDKDSAPEKDRDEEATEKEESALGIASITKVQNGRFVLPPLRAISTSTTATGNGSTPKGLGSETQRPLKSLPESGSDRSETSSADWSWTVARWEAANTFSNPRYFEDRMLERHGHERWGHLQPVVSGARFFGSVAMLPYLMSISEPCRREYTLGYYRPGSCSPKMFQRPPWDRKAILTESAAIATGMLVFP